VSSVHAIPELTKGRTICEIDRFDPDKVKGFYAKTKAAATDIVLRAAKDGLDAVVVHPSGIMGPNDFALGYSTQLVLEYLSGGLVAGIKGGYDFVDVRDVAAGIISAAKRGRRGECYILSNTFISVRRMLDTLSDVSGMKKIKTMLPLWFIRPLAPLAELYYKILHKKPLFTGYSIYTLQSNANFSHEKATRELGYSTRDLRETLSDTVAFLKDHGRINRSGRKQPLRRRRPALSRS